MFLWPTFLLDARPYLLLKLRNNNNIGFFRTKMCAKKWFHSNYVSGPGGVSDQQPAFPQSRPPLNPHSSQCIAMNPRYVQQRDDTDLVVS